MVKKNSNVLMFVINKCILWKEIDHSSGLNDGLQTLVSGFRVLLANGKGFSLHHSSRDVAES